MKKKKRMYMVVNPSGNPYVYSAVAPIYWLEKIALEEAKRFGGTVVPVDVNWTIPTSSDLPEIPSK